MEPRYKRMLKGMRAKEEAATRKSRAGRRRGRPAVAEAGRVYAGTDAGAAVKNDAVWSLYILRCSDNSFYTGVTNDIDRRFRMHQDGKASRFTRTRRPVKLVYSETCGTRSQALSRECAVKALGRKGKEDLVARGAEGSPLPAPQVRCAPRDDAASPRSAERAVGRRRK